MVHRPETQIQKKRKVQELMKKHLGEKIYPQTEGFEYLSNLVQNHPNECKRNKNIEWIYPRLQGNSIKPFIKYQNQPEDHISFNSCITGRVNCDFKKVCRLAIQQQLTYFKINNPPDYCGICKEKIHFGDSFHADHIYPLSRMINDFFGDKEPETISASPHGRDFKDKEIKRKWQVYHYDNVELQNAHSRCNCIKGSKTNILS
tara:strand:- start:282 stop:890 length:609 start_codon:yes stop_codon:yes gene_type:complete